MFNAFFFLSLFHIFTPKVKRKHRFKDRSTTSKGKSLKSYTRQTMLGNFFRLYTKNIQIAVPIDQQAQRTQCLSTLESASTEAIININSSSAVDYISNYHMIMGSRMGQMPSLLRQIGQHTCSSHRTFQIQQSSLPDFNCLRNPVLLKCIFNSNKEITFTQLF